MLVIDVGGSNVKFALWGHGEKRKFPSGKSLTARACARRVAAMTTDWKYDAVSIGFPGLVIHGRPAAEPPKLGPGWIEFPFAKVFQKPVRVINDAAMQALGAYDGGRMLFLGLGTGVGSTLILDEVVVPLELGELKWAKGKSLWQLLGKRGLRRLGTAKWRGEVRRAVNCLARAFRTDYVVIGGGNAKLLKTLPKGARRGSNDDAFAGGARLWGLGQLKAKPRKHTWVIV